MLAEGPFLLAPLQGEQTGRPGKPHSPLALPGSHSFPFPFSLVCAENSDTETTSLGSPSQPASDGFKHPVCFPELSLKTKDSPASRSLDRSVSAPSVCSPLSGWAEPASPRAVKSPDSLPEPSGPLGSKQPLALPPNLTGASAASAKVSGAGSPLGGSAPPQNTRAKTVASSCPPEEVVPGLETQEVGAKSSPHDASQEMLEAPLLQEPMEQNEVPEVCGTHRKEPSLGEQMEPLCGGDGSSPSAEEEERLGDREEGGASQAAEGKPEGALAPLLGGDPLLEGPSVPEASDPRLLGSAGGGAQDSGMELELHRPHGLPLPCGLPPASSLTQPGSAAATSRSRDRDGDQGVSLASALKELHRLLVVSAQHDFRVTQQEESCSLAAPPEGPTPAEEMSPERPAPAPSHPGVEAASSGAGTEMPQEHRSAGGREQETVVVVQGASGCSHTIPISPLAALHPQQGEECPEVVARRLSSGQSSLPSCSLGPDPRAVRGTPAPSPEGGGSAAAAERQPEDRPEPSLPLQGGFPGAHCSTLSPAADLDQIVGAGFTPQEAGEALEHAGGNADLALLLLLARNIVVPT